MARNSPLQPSSSTSAARPFLAVSGGVNPRARFFRSTIFARILTAVHTGSL